MAHHNNTYIARLFATWIKAREAERFWKRMSTGFSSARAGNGSTSLDCDAQVELRDMWIANHYALTHGSLTNFLARPRMRLNVG